MKIVKSPDKMQRIAIDLKSKGNSIGFVPTMGALHQGHLSLVRRMRKRTDIVIASIFVNPTQFSPNEDLDSYPRQFALDCKVLKDEGVDYLFFPSKTAIYPDNFDTYVVPGKISQVLEGKYRSTHFRGVTTIVLKLFNIIQPNFAIFGQKDLQQSIVIKKMVEDLNLPVKIVVAPTVRASDGLALSSRNSYLKPSERIRALVISDSLKSVRKMIIAGEKSSAKIRNYIRRQLVKQADAKIDYISVACAETLIELKMITGRVAISLACRIGKVRLIDNIVIKVD